MSHLELSTVVMRMLRHAYTGNWGAIANEQTAIAESLGGSVANKVNTFLMTNKPQDSTLLDVSFRVSQTDSVDVMVSNGRSVPMPVKYRVLDVNDNASSAMAELSKLVYTTNVNGDDYSAYIASLLVLCQQLYDSNPHVDLNAIAKMTTYKNQSVLDFTFTPFGIDKPGLERAMADSEKAMADSEKAMNKAKENAKKADFSDESLRLYVEAQNRHESSVARYAHAKDDFESLGKRKAFDYLRYNGIVTRFAHFGTGRVVA